MRAREEYEEAIRWISWGLNDCQIARMTGVPRSTVREWRWRNRAAFQRLSGACPICDERTLEGEPYSYLLGLYLGDGCLSAAGRTWRLRITLDIRYPLVVDECAAAVDSVRQGTRANFVHAPGCVVVNSYWNHWPCLFPQHGPGRKHERRIELSDWQRRCVEDHPRPFLRGLIHSDGCRSDNIVQGKTYGRYTFSNRSKEIQDLFCLSLKQVGVHCTRPYWTTVSVSRRADVALLDSFIGPKS